MKKAIFLFAACALALAQCDIWQKPLFEPILKETKKADEIEKIMVTKYPYPNTFSRDSETLAVLKNGGAVVWENECALEVSGITSGGEIRKLTVSEYMVDGFDPAALNDGNENPVTVKLTGAPDVTTSFDIAIVSFSGNYHEVKIAAGISHGTLVPFPSVQKEGELVKVYIAPDKGYAYEENSISISITPPPPIIKLDETTFTFTMPGSDVTITAGFFEAEAKLELGGNIRYFTTLEEAFGAVNSAEEAAEISVLKNITVSSEIPVTGNVTLTAASGAEKIISRGGSFTDSLFTVGDDVSLTLNAGDSLGLTLDGGKNSDIGAIKALVTVSGGMLAMGGGVTLKNNNTNNYGSGVYVGNGGEFTMSGGNISGNTANTGGGVYVSSGTFNMSGGNISGNIANTAGGVFVNNGSTFDMSGGKISGNTANTGGGVYVTYSDNAKFAMSGNAVVKQEVFLASGRKIIVSGELTPPEGEYSAEIKLASTSNGAVVLEGAGGYNLSFGDVAKFTLLDNDEGFSYSDTENNARLVSGTPSGSAIQASYSNGGVPIYGNLKTIIENVSGTESAPAIVRIVTAEVELANTVDIASGKHIKLTVADGLETTIERESSNFKSSLFNVESGGSLVLDAGSGALTLDGGKSDGMTAEAALVKVDGGTLTMGDGVALKNNNNTSTSDRGGGVYLASGGTFVMNGGEISDNRTSNINNISESNGGGGVYVDGGTFTMNGGAIRNNATDGYWGHHGGGVFIKNSGTFTMSGNSTISGNTGFDGGGVFINSGTFTMSGNSTIIGNISKANGGGVHLRGSGTFEMQGGAISGNDASTGSDYNNGGGVFQEGGTLKLFGGAIYGNTEGDTSLRNLAAPNGGAAYYKASGNSIPPDLGSTNNTIIDGVVQSQ
jgi:hypothetical protein